MIMGLRELTSKAQGSLPEPAVAGARAALTTWGKATASLRMLPDFLVIGAQRCGTTSLFRVLNDHPDVVRPTASKGIGYFDVNYAKGSRWYRSHFPLRLTSRLRTGGGAKTFESSGYYSFHPLAAERIARDLPGVKVVLMVRDPVERAYSAYKHERSRGFEDQEFEAALDLEATRLEGEEDRIRSDPSYGSFDHRHHAYVARGRYAEQLDRFIALLGREQVFVVDADRFFAKPEAELSTLFSWLGLRPWLPDHVAQWNARPSEPMSQRLRDRLSAEFEEPDLQLAAIMGRRPSWRES
jgi:hypothetical protein